MRPIPWLFVSTAYPVVGPVLPRARVCNLLLPGKSATLEEYSASCYGPVRVLFVYRKSCSWHRPSRPNRPCFCSWCICYRRVGERLLSCDWWYGFYVDGYWRFVSGSGEPEPLFGELKYQCSSFHQSGIAQSGGLTQNFQTAADQYSTGFSLALRMISVASGVTVGLLVSQVLGTDLPIPKTDRVDIFFSSLFLRLTQKCGSFCFLIRKL